MELSSRLTSATPRLRLPQKAAPVTQPLSRTQPLQREHIADLPTRPAHPPLASAPKAGLRWKQALQFGVGWDSGIARRYQANEDSLLTLQGICTYHGRLLPFGLFVVADGMGGHAGGQEASSIALQQMMHSVVQPILHSNDLSDEYLVDMLIGGVQWANQAVWQRAGELQQEMGTTLTAALVIGAKAYIVNVGDSRTYLYRESRESWGLTQVTDDHSLVASLVSSGQLKPEEMYTHPDRNKIYRSLGADETIPIDWFIVDLCSHDRLLLCSDGLWEMVRDPLIGRILGSCADPQQACDMLVQAALRGGGDDNVSAIVVRIPVIG